MGSQDREKYEYLNSSVQSSESFAGDFLIFVFVFNSFVSLQHKMIFLNKHSQT